MGLGAAAAVTAAGALGGAYMSSQASKSAASKVQGSQAQALQFQQGVYNTTGANEQPYIGTGQNALYSLASLYGLPGQNGAPASSNGTPGAPNGAAAAYQNYENTPAYQFQLGQGNLSAERGLAASGLTGSGAEGKALQQYGQGYASSGFNGYISQLASLAGMGQSGIATQANAGVGAGSQVGQTLTNSGNAAAAGTMGSNTAVTNGISQSLGALTQSNSAYGSNNSNQSPGTQSFLNSVNNSSNAGGNGSALSSLLSQFS